jgi:hypothetical protein
MIEPMMFFQMNMSADIDPGGFHIITSNHIDMSTFEIMLKTSNKWVGFRRDYAPIHTQNHMTMLGGHLFRVKMIQKDKGLSLLHAPGVPDLAECQADISVFGL